MAPITRPPTPVPGQAVPVTQTWWFWTLIGVGSVAVVAGVTVAIIQAQPPTAYDVFVNVNPPN